MSEIPEGTEGERPAGDERPRLRAIPAPAAGAGTSTELEPTAARAPSAGQPVRAAATARSRLPAEWVSPGLPEWGRGLWAVGYPTPGLRIARLRATGLRASGVWAPGLG